jgi:hypothetical protein
MQLGLLVLLSSLTPERHNGTNGVFETDDIPLELNHVFTY